VKGGSCVTERCVEAIWWPTPSVKHWKSLPHLRIGCSSGKRSRLAFG
jgi:hypothetical protein